MRQRTQRQSSGFKYKKRSDEQLKRRASQSGGLRDRYIDNKYLEFRPGEGVNRIRMLPPTWTNPNNPEETPDHWGYDIFVHYSIGPDNSAYLCLDKMKGPGSGCPMCAERLVAESEGDSEYSDSLRPTRRVLVWLINRKKEEDGPMLWAGPQKLDGDLFKLANGSDEGVLFIDDPEEGYDVEFDYSLPVKKTPGKYDALRIVRRSSSIDNKEWLKYVEDNPAPDALRYYDSDYIDKMFTGKPKVSEEKQTESETSTPERETGRKGRSEKGTSINLSYEEVHELSAAQLDDLSAKIEIELTDVMTDGDVADAICKCAGLEPNKREAKDEVEPSKENYRDRLKRLREKQK